MFAGDWSYTDAGRVPVGFVGTLIDTWNGWAVFTCTRAVAEAIVAEQGRLRKAERARIEAGAVRGRNRARAVNEAICPMWWDGDEIVVDERVMHPGDEGLSRIAPDEDGLYIVNGWRWTWRAVDPADCDQIAGLIPPYGRHQQFVLLTHTPLRVPHDRLTVTSLTAVTIGGGQASSAVLKLDGRKVGTVDNHGDGGPTQFHPVGKVTEYDLGRQIRRAASNGQHLIRVTADGFCLATYTLEGPPITGGHADAVVADLNQRDGGSYPPDSVWEIWRTNRWAYLGPVGTPEPPTGN